MYRKILAMLLAVLLLAPTVVSCSDNEEHKETTEDTTISTDGEVESESEAETKPLTALELRQIISDDLEANNFGGQSFRVLTNASDENDKLFEIIADELTGDTCNDAVYERNLNIEDRFKVKITCEQNVNPQEIVRESASSGSNDFDLAGCYNYKSGIAISAGSVFNWLEVPHVNLEKPWHNASANDCATINGRLYAICSDYSITSMTYTHATFFNVEMLEGYGYSAQDMYNLVFEGKWTIDKLSEIVSGIYTDVNGDGKKDKGDIYGYGYNLNNPADVWLTAFGMSVATFEEDGSYTLHLGEEKAASIIEKLVDFHHNNQGVFIPEKQYDEELYFLNGQFAMAPLRFMAAYTTLRDMDATYSLLPYPKWDEAQEGYYTNADDKWTAFMIPLSAYENLDFIGTIYEALCAESYKRVYPAYYDTALKGRYSSDETMAQMVDLIMEGRKFDFSFQFGETYFLSTPYLIRDMIKNKKTNIASQFEKKEKKLRAKIDGSILPLYGIGEAE